MTRCASKSKKIRHLELPKPDTSRRVFVVGEEFVTCKHKMNLFDMRIFDAIYYFYAKNDTKETRFKIDIPDLAEILAYETKTLQRRLQDSAHKILETKIYTIQKLPDKWELVNLFAGFSKSWDTLEIELTSYGSRFFNENKCTPLDMIPLTAIGLASEYSYRLYKFLKSKYPLNSEITVTINELFSVLGVEPDVEYKNVKRWAIKTSQVEIKRICEIAFDFYENKKNRKVESVKFAIRKNFASPPLPLYYQNDEFDKQSETKKLNYLEFVNFVRFKSICRAGSGLVVCSDKNSGEEFKFDGDGHLYSTRTLKKLKTNDAKDKYKRIYEMYLDGEISEASIYLRSAENAS